jgi:predicted esterase
MTADLHDSQPVLTAGANLDEAAGAIVLIHGRGGSAADILALAPEVGGDALACLAPQANKHTWYPFSFLKPIEMNQPFLDSALARIGSLLDQIAAAGVPRNRTILLGFSQGACLSSEYVARNAQRYGGLILFSGGLIGPDGTPRDYPGSLDGTPVFLGCSNVDAHIPEARVLETGDVLQRMGGAVEMRIYPGMGHTINQDELMAARSIVDQVITAGAAPSG